MEKTKEQIQQELEGEVAKAQAEAEAQLPAEKKAEIEAKRKAEADAKAKEAEALKAEEALLAKKEEERTPEEKEQAKTIIEKRRVDEENKMSAEDKIKRTQEATQRRIDEMSNKLKQIEDEHSKEAQDLKQKIALLEQENANLQKRGEPAKAEDIGAILDKKESERIVKYLEEDRNKPRERRRELTKDELDEWLLEDLGAAQRWIVSNENRRDRERQSDLATIKRENSVKELRVKQNESGMRVDIRHPEIALANKEEELLRSQGKGNEEIRTILAAKYPKYKVLMEVVQDAPEKVMLSPNAPELLAAEMERRMNIKPESTQTEDQRKIAALEEQIAHLQARLDGNEDTNGVTSTRSREIPAGKLLPDEEQVVSEARGAGLPEDKVQAALESYRAKKGKK